MNALEVQYERKLWELINEHDKYDNVRDTIAAIQQGTI